MPPRKRAAEDDGAGPTTRSAKAPKTEQASPAKGRGGRGKKGPKANMAASTFKARALPLHINITHTPPVLADDGTVSVASTDPGFVGTTTLVPSTFATGSYGWKGSKRLTIELENPNAEGGEDKEKEKVHVMLTINATVMGSKGAKEEEEGAEGEAEAETKEEGAEEAAEEEAEKAVEEAVAADESKDENKVDGEAKQSTGESMEGVKEGEDEMLADDAYTSYADDDDELEDWPGDPRTPSRRFHRRARTTDDEGDGEGDEDDDILYGDDLDADDADEPSQGFATHTAFDAYFKLASKPARTSSNVFSALLSPVPPEDVAPVLAAPHARAAAPALWADARMCRAAYRRFRTELAEGFNLLFYGCGSKRTFLNGFAAWLAEEGGHVVVANGFQPSFAFRDLLGAIERVPGVLEEDGAESGSGSGSAGGLDAQVQRIHAFFSRPAHELAGEDADANADEDEDEGEGEGEDEGPPHLYIIAHNIESAAFRAPKHRSALALLALAPRIHLCASFDHVVGTPLRWSLSEIFARKPAPSTSSTTPSSSHGPTQDATTTTHTAAVGVAPKRGFAWLWHDLTTLAPYDFELAYADPSVLTGASALRGAKAPAASSAYGVGVGAAGGAAGMGPGGAGAMTETAARHILASVTQKAKKLFVLLGTKQLEVMDASAANAQSEQQAVGAGAGEGEGAYDYDRLFAAARDNFVAQNDTALRALLGEFRDHGLVVSVQGAGGAGGGEALWIPLRREALLKVVADLKAEGAGWGCVCIDTDMCDMVHCCEPGYEHTRDRKHTDNKIQAYERRRQIHNISSVPSQAHSRSTSSSLRLSSATRSSSVLAACHSLSSSQSSTNGAHVHFVPSGRIYPSAGFSGAPSLFACVRTTTPSSTKRRFISSCCCAAAAAARRSDASKRRYCGKYAICGGPASGANTTGRTSTKSAASSSSASSSPSAACSARIRPRVTADASHPARSSGRLARTRASGRNVMFVGVKLCAGFCPRRRCCRPPGDEADLGLPGEEGLGAPGGDHLRLEDAREGGPVGFGEVAQERLELGEGGRAAAAAAADRGRVEHVWGHVREELRALLRELAERPG
ncbi:origin recognition complex subunit 2-domain-containing protein [Cubamyces lactineus]|nr:origin recognition complex subunit 2-domain-containing protein [Cubamyces lactineus]